jgi:hypothetical protein
MTRSLSRFGVAGSILASVWVAGCSPAQQAPPPATSAPPTPFLSTLPTSSAPMPASTAAPPPPVGPRFDRHVYRFDFVLSSSEGAGTPTTTSFTLSLEDGDHGELMVGKNVPLTTTIGPGDKPISVPRQDVGLKVSASVRSIGDDLLLEVSTEMSTWEPPSTIRKIVAKGGAFAPLGKPATVLSLDDDKKHYQLTVTPQKLP